MSGTPLISVIVPVYKVEAYLDRCVQSIVDQTYTNLEIILVDDGSPDRCPQMCDEWAKRDSRIRVIHKENGGGGGEARNVGIQAARGSFVGFVDSDDYISEEFYEHLYSLMDSDVDIAECGYILTSDDCACFDTAKEIRRAECCTCREAFEQHLEDRHFRQLVWNKLYRAEVLQDVLFPVGKKIDDEFWTYRVIANAKKLVRSEIRLYVYRQQMDSVTHQLYSLDRLQAVEAKCCRALFVKEKFPELHPLAKQALWFGCLYQAQIVCKTGDAEIMNQVFPLLRKYYDSCELKWSDLNGVKVTHRIWLLLGKVSLRFTCVVRNALGIGV